MLFRDIKRWMNKNIPCSEIGGLNIIDMLFLLKLIYNRRAILTPKFIWNNRKARETREKMWEKKSEY